jgi:hypothetical protein
MTDNPNPSENVVDDLQLQQLPGFIHIDEKDSGSYAVHCKSTYVKDGKVFHERDYLGLVIDQENGVFHNRKRGFFSFDLINGYGEVDPAAIAKYTFPKVAMLNFGDIWLVDQILKQIGLDDILENLIPNAGNTVKSLVAFRLLSPNAYKAAERWYCHSYARLLYPEAAVSSAMTSRYIAKLGDEDVYTQFFHSYLSLLSKDQNIADKISFPILIDSTGLPNDIKTYLTATNNHNGIVSNEIRLIYVVDKNTKLPIFFRYVPGNIIDNSTFITTINSLVAYGIDVSLVIMDAGYSCLENIIQLIDFKISFITRMTKNRKEHKELIANYGQNLETAENHILFGDRGLYGKKVQITLENRQLYAYIMLDISQKAEESIKVFKKYDGKPNETDEIRKKLETVGKFILLSSDDYDVRDILALYYNRQTIEQVFDISKNFADILPLRAHSNETIRGRLLIGFIVTIIYIIIGQKLGNLRVSTNEALNIMFDLKFKEHGKSRILSELTKAHKDILNKLNIKCPYVAESGLLLGKKPYYSGSNSGSEKTLGRPKGSKNKKITGGHATLHTDGSEMEHSKTLGRPKGSKNRAKINSKSDPQTVA